MRTLVLTVSALALAGSLAAQGRARIGPTVSTISIQDASGGSHSFSSFGGTFAFLSGEDGEIGAQVSRYGDLSNDNCVRKMTFFGVESNYYPVGAKGIAPFASTAIGLARVTDQDIKFLGGCGLVSTPPAPSNQLGLGFGLGLRLNLGTHAAALVEGRFFQVPNSAIQSLEGRANVSLAFGKPPKTEILAGTLGPAVGWLVPLSGALEGRGPTLGVRFRRDKRKAGTLGLQIDYAPLKVTRNCSSQCDPSAVLFAPAYEPSFYTLWGRVYADFGFLLAGFPSAGADRGIAQGLHGGLGTDIFSGNSLMWNVNARAQWIQRNQSTDRNAFLLQLGASVSPRLEHQSGIESR